MAHLKTPRFGKIDKQHWNHSGDIARAVLAEFLGTALFVFVGVGSTISTGTPRETNGGTVTTDASFVAQSIAYGLTLVAIVATFADISGGHFNPAVSAAFFVTGNMSFLRTAAYISAQGWLMETIVTFALIFVILGTMAEKEKAVPLAPIPDGFIVAGTTICAARFTSFTDPVLSFGPSVVFGEWRHGQHWLYWIGPIGGGIIAGLAYELVFLCARKKGDEADVNDTEAADQGVGQSVQNQPSRTARPTRARAHEPEVKVALPSGAV
ncbi:aquaporin [Klebsormidium nitens]|uniref:Aquaporin n=1 Tax=Klebsormidium nitens TaxID=105231 RepID=A0A0U9HMW0_KLENI|nr:aquaporin [Klebsormidium nitens]|eukprot:GAQ81006.1 aquaporin [Klebsormidium nitens]